MVATSKACGIFVNDTCHWLHSPSGNSPLELGISLHLMFLLSYCGGGCYSLLYFLSDGSLYMVYYVWLLHLLVVLNDD